METRLATATVTLIEPESIPVTTSQDIDSVIVTTVATYCSGCTCQQGMQGVVQTVLLDIIMSPVSLEDVFAVSIITRAIHGYLFHVCSYFLASLNLLE